MNIDVFKNYQIFVKTQDAEHLALLEKFGEMVKFAKVNDLASVKRLANEIVVDFNSHCETEENHFNEIKYPHIAYHKIAHIELKIKFKQLAEHINKFEDLFEPRPIIFILHDFEKSVLDHVDNHDRQYAEYAHKHGMA